MMKKDQNQIYRQKKSIPIGIKKEQREKIAAERTKFKFKGCGCNA
ncbi:hypothetical protein [Rossellomorea marisflavi]|nr:hypothetical protein [Rossellomorea marisflavi]MDR4937087.1 hypothetical protein [Rossellomorea marisflavi]MDW4526573.1 hypothetical protein [Rossellomorea marisflavi]WJV17048.1 hypothetical protein QU593_12825 [Rossellomorea marisflavi]GLI83170.1 hypothetical protein ANABIO32_08600 [Rossellomorea marisflavi]